MPVQSCQLNNRPGFKFGPTGTCYVGRGARKRAARQGRAIEASQARTDNACGCGHVHNVTTRTRSVPTNPLKADPSRTITLRRMFTVAIRKRFLRLKSKIIQLVDHEDAFGIRQVRNQERDDGRKGKPEGVGRGGRGGHVAVSPIKNKDGTAITGNNRHNMPPNIRMEPMAEVLEKTATLVSNGDVLIANRRFAFESTPRQVDLFEAWLRGQIDADILGGNGDRYWERFIQQGYEKGAGRAFQDVRFSEFAAKGDDVSDFFEGTREEFLRSSFAVPETVEKVQLLASRTFRDLKNVTEDMAAKMSRVLADGLVAGQNPRVITRELNKQIDGLGIGSMNARNRAEVLARTEILRAHNEAQLDSFERLGVDKVGVMAEWSTAGDDRVCFPAGTMVTTPTGQTPIQLLKSGDLVKTRGDYQKVVHCNSRLYTGSLVRITTKKTVVHSTSEHPFWVVGAGWQRAIDIDRRDSLRSSKGESLRVLDARESELNNLFVYNIQVENQPEFYANGLLVHNCPICQPLEGVVMTIREARGSIPIHPSCRCVWLPSNVGEDPNKKRRVRFTDPKTGKISTTKVGQKRTKAEIDGAIDKSLRAALPKRTKRTIAQQRAISPLGGKTIMKKRPKSILDEPT